MTDESFVLVGPRRILPQVFVEQENYSHSTLHHRFRRDGSGASSCSEGSAAPQQQQQLASLPLHQQQQQLASLPLHQQQQQPLASPPLQQQLSQVLSSTPVQQQAPSDQSLGDGAGFGVAHCQVQLDRSQSPFTPSSGEGKKGFPEASMDSGYGGCLEQTLDSTQRSFTDENERGRHYGGRPDNSSLWSSVTSPILSLGKSIKGRPSFVDDSHAFPLKMEPHQIIGGIVVLVILASVGFALLIGINHMDNLNGKQKSIQFGGEKRYLTLREAGRILETEIRDETGQVLGGKRAAIQFAFDQNNPANAEDEGKKKPANDEIHSASPPAAAPSSPPAAAPSSPPAAAPSSPPAAAPSSPPAAAPSSPPAVVVVPSPAEAVPTPPLSVTAKVQVSDPKTQGGKMAVTSLEELNSQLDLLHQELTNQNMDIEKEIQALKQVKEVKNRKKTVIKNLQLKTNHRARRDLAEVSEEMSAHVESNVNAAATNENPAGQTKVKPLRTRHTNPLMENVEKLKVTRVKKRVGGVAPAEPLVEKSGNKIVEDGDDSAVRSWENGSLDPPRQSRVWMEEGEDEEDSSGNNIEVDFDDTEEDLEMPSDADPDYPSFRSNAESRKRRAPYKRLEKNRLMRLSRGAESRKKQVARAPDFRKHDQPSATSSENGGRVDK